MQNMNKTTKHRVLRARMHGLLEALLLDDAAQADQPEVDYNQPWTAGTAANVASSQQGRKITPPLVRQAYDRVHVLVEDLYPKE